MGKDKRNLKRNSRTRKNRNGVVGLDECRKKRNIDHSGEVCVSHLLPQRTKIGLGQVQISRDSYLGRTHITQHGQPF